MMDEKEKKDIAGDADACADCTAGDTEDKKSAGCAKDAKDKKEHSGSEAKKHKSRIAELERELEEEKKKSAEAGDKYLRTLAEYDNFRRRSKEERDAMYADAVGESVRELLPIIDNLKRASQYTDSEKLSEGVAMILNSERSARSSTRIFTTRCFTRNRRSSARARSWMCSRPDTAAETRFSALRWSRSQTESNGISAARRRDHIMQITKSKYTEDFHYGKDNRYRFRNNKLLRGGI